MLKLLRSWTKRRVFILYSESIYIFGTVSNPRKNTTWVTWLPNFQNFVCVYYYKAWDLRVNLPKFLTKSLYKISITSTAFGLNLLHLLNSSHILHSWPWTVKMWAKVQVCWHSQWAASSPFFPAKSVASRRELGETPRVPRGTLASISFFAFFFFFYFLTHATNFTKRRDNS